MSRLKQADGAKGPGEARRYYGQRAGLSAPALSFERARSLIVASYSALKTAGWYQEWFGYFCVDAQDVHGKAGPDPEGFLHAQLWIANLWPLGKKLETVDETTLFSVIELLFDCVSAPLEGRYHEWSNCGWHYTTFDGEAGRIRWRSDVNRVLEHYGEGFQLSEDGEVQRLGAIGVRELVRQPLPAATPRSDREKLDAAVRAYRHFSASRADRIGAIRNLVDILEFHRKKIEVGELSGDEKDLFNIANNFAIRHHHERQKEDYSDEFVEWLFHLYLSTAHLALRLAHGPPPPSDLKTARGATPDVEAPSDYDDLPF